MRVPSYQNILQIFFSFIYLTFYTVAVNTVNPSGDLDIVEGLLYVFTFGFVCDELSKLWKVGRYYFSFWSALNSVLYALLTVSFVTRMIALGHPLNSEGRHKFNGLSYNFLAFTAPLFWARLLLYLDTFRFFGTMFVVLKVMMRESIIFFALLFIVLVGFLQAFVGLNQVDDNAKAVNFVVASMLDAIMGSPAFEGFDNYSPPFGIVLYYLYTFVVMVVLLNILIALYNSAYQDITDNATDEYLALFAQKTMQYVRAPDENVFISPLNLIEIFVLVLPLEWWMPKSKYERFNYYIMAIIYSPLLVLTAALETRQAHLIRSNKRRGVEDEDECEEWEQLQDQCDFEADGWDRKVCETKPNVEQSAITECMELKKQLAELKTLVEKVLREERSTSTADSS